MESEAPCILIAGEPWKLLKDEVAGFAVKTGAYADFRHAARRGGYTAELQ